MNVFDLQAKIGLNKDDYEKGIKSAGESLKSLAGGVASGIKNIAKITAAGIGAAATGIGAITKQAVESYANYEQLVGGVETLFKDSAGIVQKYADEAYKTAGLSANEYMETVTSFSASLLQSLNGDTAAAAEKANMAIIDMSDNANKMGTSMEAIQNAYNGFAKQNFTMLDNLKLGYGGTAAEMERLMTDAEKIDSSFTASRDASGKLTMSYAEIVDAIHIVQTNMDITGTTAREAATTIAGSVSMVKASWENLVTGVADDTQNFDSLISNFVDSIDTAAGNILPRVEVALTGVGKLVERVVPQLLDRIPKMLGNLLPNLTKSAVNLVSALGKALVKNTGTLLKSVRSMLASIGASISNDSSFGAGFVEVVESLAKYVPDILEFFNIIAFKIIRSMADGMGNSGSDIINALLDGIAEAADNVTELVRVLGNAIKTALAKIDLSESAGEMINSIVGAIATGGEQLMVIALQIVNILADTISENSDTIFANVSYLMQEFMQIIAEYLPDIMDAGFKVLTAIGEGILENAPELIDTAIFVVEFLGDYLTQNAPLMASKLADLVGKIAVMLTDPETIGKMVDVAIVLINTLADSLIATLPVFLEYAPQIIENLSTALQENTPKLLDAAWSIIKELTNAILVNLPEIIESGKSIIDSIGTGMMSVLMSIGDIYKKMMDTAKEKRKEGEQELIRVGSEIIENIIEGIENLKADVTAKAAELMALVVTTMTDKIEEFKKGFTELVEEAKTWGKDIIDNFIGGIKQKWENLKGTVSDVAQTVKDFLGFSEPKSGPLSNFHTYAPDMMDLYAKGIKDNTNKVTAQLESSLSDVKGAFDVNSTESNSAAVYGGGNVYNITVTAGTVSSDYDARRAAQIMSEELSSLKSMQSMAVGG